MGFNLENYETVASRLDRWLVKYELPEAVVPRTRVETELVHYTDNRCVFKASIYIDNILVSTGWAEETRGEGMVNKTSHVENCESSAVGRALANAGLAGSDPSKRPSREEMEKVQRASAPRPTPAPAPAQISPAQVAENVAALREITRVFDAKPVERPGANRVKNTNDPATRAQIGKIIGLSMSQNYSKEDRMQLASSHAGREITDLAQLTKGEASDLINLLDMATR
jgi:hypothetical protein